MRDDAAQRGDRGLELLQGRGVFLADDQIDLLRQRSHRFVEADQVLGRRQVAQRVAHFGEAAFEPGQRRGIDTPAVAGMVDALRQRLHFDLQRFHRVARQRFGDLAADFGELLAEARYDLFEIVVRPQRFDPRRDVRSCSSRSLLGRSVSMRVVILRNCSSSLEISRAGAAGTLGAGGSTGALGGSGCGCREPNDIDAGAASGCGAMNGTGARGARGGGGSVSP